ncbi:phosphatidate cytidylyltransferase [Thermosyntropha sp.]|uniref:phosphatidate cytidylyltransferase n=1 Tax=Thermosyntropha sp. TaxID=2740820 RepID=UPI0025E4651E|nr:phosphatidate cytidylyltransferase [Thermosyntropha sp.]MBO8159384.1 phosphatidate cytidylyltransferase [Thermosyntropha sp.]
MLKERVLSAVIGIPFILGILYLGGIWWQGFFLLLAILGLFEIYRMMSLRGFKPLFTAGYFFMFLCFFSNRLDFFNLTLFLALALFLAILETVLRFDNLKLDSVALTIFSSLYVGFLLSYALKILNFEHSFAIMLLAFILTWSTDIGGYFFGKRWGRHKMAPNLSPKKTWEGAAGGIFLADLAVLAFFKITGIFEFNIIYIVLLGLSTSIIAQIGDLFASSIKRFFQVKDSGNIIPGHGGILDRFDSFMLVIPLVYYWFYFLG